jgi:hypothetical protein
MTYDICMISDPLRSLVVLLVVVLIIAAIYGAAAFGEKRCNKHP